MEHITNNPEVSLAFRSEELQLFFQRFLRELEDPYVLKEFIKNGFEKTWEEQLAQLKKSFIPITKGKEKNQFLEVERCIDGKRFKVGDVVIDQVAKVWKDNERKLPIGLMYEDDRGLHVRLDVVPEPNLTLTWRDLSTIEKQ